MKSLNSWFDVSKKGLAELQSGKPKHFVARELIQNAWDEDTTVCDVHIVYDTKERKATVMVEDDNPDGFKDLADAYTLFAPTYKRDNPEKRGRFNLGEKQVFSICEEAIISTTKGYLHFTKNGKRKQSASMRNKGSVVIAILKMTKHECEEMLDIVKTYIVPEGIRFIVNDEEIHCRKSLKRIKVSLTTEIRENEVFKKALRMTTVDIYKKSEKAILYEMGIPVTEIGCEFDINVNQKIPLSIDRDTVSQTYLSALFAEVLNVTYELITEDKSSDQWIREATSNNRIIDNAVKTIINKRYGDKVVVANPFDRNSIDRAIASGYKVITGNEMSKEEWENVRESEAIKSSSELFGSNFVNSTPYAPDENMKDVAELAKKIARHCFNTKIGVYFAKWKGGVGAEFGENNLTFNVQNLGKKFFDPPVSEKTIDLIVHEIGHLKGNHTEMNYHQALTKMAGKLTMTAIENKSFFD